MPKSSSNSWRMTLASVRVPVQTLLESTDKAFGTLSDFMDYAWFLRPYRYSTLDSLLASLQVAVITPAEDKARELDERRKAIEEELTKQQLPDKSNPGL